MAIAPANKDHMSFEYFDKQSQIMVELGFSSDKLGKLRQYVELLWAENEELNLISRKMTIEVLIDNHIIDCLIPLKLFPQNIKTCSDFGSGGGMPAVIYAIQFPEMKYILFEKSPKKQEFLKKCASIAPNIQVRGDIPKELTGVDLVTARAFKPLDVILDMSRSYFKAGGRYFLLKGRMDKIQEEERDARKKFKDINVKVEALKSPVLEVERHLVMVNF